MQDRKNHGFTLIPDTTPLLYNEVRGMISQACIASERSFDSRANIPESATISFVLQKDPRVYGTINVSHGIAFFGIYADGVIKQEAQLSLFVSLVKSPAGEKLPARCMEQFRLLLEGAVPQEQLASPQIISAWKNYFSDLNASASQTLTL